MSSRIPDLTEDASVYRLLRSDTLAWRQRLVERFEFGSDHHVHVTTGYQCELPPQLLDHLLPVPHERRNAEAIRCLVPITARSKRPLLDFGLDGPSSGNAQLLLRTDIAALQAGYLEEVISTSFIRSELRAGLRTELIEAISVFTPGVYDRLTNSDEPTGGDIDTDALRRYLRVGLGFPLAEPDLAACIAATKAAGNTLADRIEENPDQTSSSENVLLAIPLMRERPTTSEGVRVAVERYAKAVRVAADNEEWAVLDPLADFGRRWDVIVETQVPLNEPWTMRVTEERPLRWDAGTSTQTLSLGDARSAHFEFTLTDPTVTLRRNRHEARSLRGQQIEMLGFDDVRETSESLSIYTSTGADFGPREAHYLASWADTPDDDLPMPYYVDVAIAFTRPRYLTLASWFVVGLVVVAAGTAALADNDDLVDTLTLLTVPATFAAAILLVREATALAAQLDRWPRAALGAAVTALWTIVLARVVSEGTSL